MEGADVTSELFIEPSALAVDLPEELVVLCHEVLPAAGLRVHRLEGAAAAGEHIASRLPKLVVVPASMSPGHVAMLEDCAIAVGAVVICLDPTHGYPMLTAQLAETVRQLRSRYGRG